MAGLDRRTFLKAGGALALAGLAGPDPAAWAEAPADTSAIHLKGDGLSLRPPEYTRLLEQMAADGLEKDDYGNGGIIGRLEETFATLLGKETAVFLPTGTLANHIAVRRLAGDRRRVIVQADSHLYNDAGDCAQQLSGLNLMPVDGPFNPESIFKALDRARSGRVTTEVGMISLESPLRRGFNSIHTLDEMAAVAEFARGEGLGLHLDGARLFMQAAHSGVAPADCAAHFDTVYVSLYKNFNAAGGAILAGRAETLADLYQERRMFGGSPYNVWPMAAPAGLFAEGFIGDYRAGRAVADGLRAELGGDRRFAFETIPGGSNGFWLKLNGVDPADFVKRLAERDIHLIPPRPQWDGLLLMINPTWARITAGDLAAAFRTAAG